MDFTLSQDQEALRDLARQILGDIATHDHLKEIERAGGWWHRPAWDALAKASLLGIAIPEEFGGSGLGLSELMLLVEEIGRAVAPVPVLPSLVLGALPVLRAGTPAQKQAILPGVAAGTTILSGALEEPQGDPLRPSTTATKDGTRWRLDGVKHAVPAADLAHRILVSAKTGPDAAGLFFVDPNGAGVTRTTQLLTNGEPHAELTLAGATATDVIGDPAAGTSLLAWVHAVAVTGYCTMQVGVCDRAIRMAADYTMGREQFGRAIATFQAVQQRLADAFVDVEAVRMSAWEAVYRLDHDLPADESVKIAKFWAADGGQRAAVAAQHLHGGIGVDIDYPLHRYFLWAKHIELVLGPGIEHLASLGADIAAGRVA